MFGIRRRNGLSRKNVALFDKYLEAWQEENADWERHYGSMVSAMIYRPNRIPSASLFAYFIPTVLNDTAKWEEEWVVVGGWRYHTSHVTGIALQHPLCPVGLLAQAMKSPNPSYVQAASYNPNCPVEALVEHYLRTEQSDVLN